mgnify:FL=1
MSIKVLELVLIVVAALGIGFWQLYDVNKELKKDRERRDDDRESGDE